MVFKKVSSLTFVNHTISNWSRLACACPDDAQIFVVGDVHGQAKVLAHVLDDIAQIDATGVPRRLIFLGDLIDRGPDSFGAVRLAMQAAERARVDDVIILPGNHELMMLDAILMPDLFMTDWLDNGGIAVANEVVPNTQASRDAKFAATIKAAFDPDFLSIMANGSPYHKAADLLFVHAGLAPDEDADTFLSQERFGASGAHWAWIREPFLEWQSGWGPQKSWFVVHGHTPVTDKPLSLGEFLPLADKVKTHGRLCLDAGAAFGIPQIAWAEFANAQYRVGLVSEGA